MSIINFVFAFFFGALVHYATTAETLTFFDGAVLAAVGILAIVIMLYSVVVELG